MKFAKLDDVLKEAQAKGVGVIAMKTLAGAKQMNFDPKGQPFEPAALKWVLGHPEVAGLVITISSVSHLDLYLSASGEKFTAGDQRVLAQYARRFGNEYCRTGCNDCESACPEGVPIASILRYQMYFKEYGMEKRAMASYAGTKRQASACLNCSAETCTNACPFGLSVAGFLRDAHSTLTFQV